MILTNVIATCGHPERNRSEAKMESKEHVESASFDCATILRLAKLAQDVAPLRVLVAQ